MFKIEDILLRIPNMMSDEECDFLIEEYQPIQKNQSIIITRSEIIFHIVVRG